MLATEINAKLNQNGYSISMIAEALSVSQSSVSQVISRSAYSKRIATAIAKAANLPIEKVFPDRPQYHEGYSKKANRDQKVNALRQALAS